VDFAWALVNARRGRHLPGVGHGVDFDEVAHDASGWARHFAQRSKVGGPETTGPAAERRYRFWRAALRARGRPAICASGDGTAPLPRRVLAPPAPAGQSRPPLLSLTRIRPDTDARPCRGSRSSRGFAAAFALARLAGRPGL